MFGGAVGVFLAFRGFFWDGLHGFVKVSEGLLGLVGVAFLLGEAWSSRGLSYALLDSFVGVLVSGLWFWGYLFHCFFAFSLGEGRGKFQTLSAVEPWGRAY